MNSKYKCFINFPTNTRKVMMSLLVEKKTTKYRKIWFSIPCDTLSVISEMIFAASHLTGAKNQSS